MAFRPDRPFSRRAATAAGIGWRALSSADYRQIHFDRHVAATVMDDLLLRCSALMTVLPPERPFSHHTAATLWGGFVPVSSSIHISLHGEDRTSRAGVKLHRYRYPLEFTTRFSLPVTTPEMTFGHMARELDLLDLVTLGDSLVRINRTTASNLQEIASRWPGQHRRLVTLAANLVRPRVASPQETRTRLLLVLAGLPEPECDMVLRRDADGSVEWRLDLAYPAARVAVEYDGLWHRDADQSEHDRVRREILAKMGWDIIVVTSRDLHDHPETLLHRVREALARRGVRVQPRLKDDWRRHFRVQLSAA